MSQNRNSGCDLSSTTLTSDSPGKGTGLYFCNSNKKLTKMSVTPSPKRDFKEDLYGLPDMDFAPHIEEGQLGGTFSISNKIRYSASEMKQLLMLQMAPQSRSTYVKPKTTFFKGKYIEIN
jgi:hypothetical protein